LEKYHQESIVGRESINGKVPSGGPSKEEYHREIIKSIIRKYHREIVEKVFSKSIIGGVSMEKYHREYRRESFIGTINGIVPSEFYQFIKRVFEGKT